MAETWTRAFGRYLRTIRERRGLSLEDVASLSQAFADTLNKGYLSRCENGHQRLAFSKVIPLSRIYEVPADVLVERMELDMELDRAGGPETEGKTFEELYDAGRRAFHEGRRWEGYGCFRDAVLRAGLDPLVIGFENHDEQVARSYVNCGTAATGLGRYRYALHEFLYVRESGAIGAAFSPIVLERISVAYRSLNELDAARHFADAADEAADETPDKTYAGYLFSSRGILALNTGDWDSAESYLKSAFEAFKASGHEIEKASCLHNLGQLYFNRRRYRAARRALAAGQRLLPEDILRPRVLAHILLGEIDSIEGSTESATHHWKTAASIAKTLNDKVLRFKAEYFLLRQAHAVGDAPVARAITRRLRKLCHWVPKTTPELTDFLRLDAEESARSRS